ncbi:MAG: hypothetical protein BWY77_01955 [bacterium ADurb.Bin431]|nr:MAG: hypothetical protein BWY77_01955 [bacterium ADurb.Bin431]
MGLIRFNQEFYLAGRLLLLLYELIDQLYGTGSALARKIRRPRLHSLKLLRYPLHIQAGQAVKVRPSGLQLFAKSGSIQLLQRGENTCGGP